jgi:DNA-binding MarR family transcriptional regulator
LSKRYFPLAGIKVVADGLHEMTKDAGDLKIGILGNLVGHLLRHGFNLGQSVFKATFDDEGITPLQFMIMELVLNNPGISHSRLCLALGTSASVITTTLKPVLAAGRIIGSPMAGDARQTVYVTTNAGRQAHKRMQPLIANSEKTLTKALSETERAELARLLRLMIGESGRGEGEGSGCKLPSRH